MFKLSFLILIAQLITVNVFSQSSPHGDNLNIKCSVCHISANWTNIVINKDSFNHNNTKFPLVGQHQTVSCKKCHVDLKFDKAKTDCNSCHQDVHQPSIGKDCERCHTQATWIVKNNTHVGQFDINGKTDCTRCHSVDSWKSVKFDHNTAMFKLEGAHMTVKCNECHKVVLDEKGKYVQYKFKNIECSNCHS